MLNGLNGNLFLKIEIPVLMLFFITIGFVCLAFYIRKLLKNVNESEVRFQSLFDHNPDLVLSIDVEGKILMANQRASEVSGYAISSIIGTHFLEYVPEEKREAARNYFQQTIKGNSDTHEMSILHRDGHEVILRQTAIPRIVGGAIAGTFVVGKDITEQQATQKALEIAQQDLIDTVKNQQGMIFKIVKRGDEFISTLCDGDLLHRMGFSDGSDFIGKDRLSLIPDDLSSHVRGFYERAWAGEENVSYEGEVNGVKYFASLKSVKRNNQVVEVIGSCVDITGKKKAESALKNSEERYRQVVETMPDGVIVKHDGVITYANPAACKILGAVNEDLVGASILDYINVEYHEVARESSNYPEGQFSETETVFWRKDGESVDVHVICMPFVHPNGEHGVQMIFSDITEKLQSERALRESEAKYRFIADYTTDLVMVVDTDGVVQYASPSHYPVLGFHPSAYEGRSAFKKVHGDAVDESRAKFDECLATKKPVFIQTKIENSKGEYEDFEFNVTPALNDSGEIQNLVVVGRVITDRVKLENKLNQSREALVYAQHIAKLGNWDYTPETDELSCSAETFKIFGLEPRDLVTPPDAVDFVHPNDRECFLKMIDIVKAGKTGSLEHRIVRRDGTIRYVKHNLEGIRDADGNVKRYFATVQDITDSKITDELLRKSDKLAVAGQMAAGVAHEIRNPLTAIKGFLQFGQFGTLKPEYFNIMLTEVTRMEGIISDFLSFTKPHATSFKESDLDGMLDEVIALLNTQAIMKSIGIVRTGTPIPSVVCDVAQLKQVFINLLRNSTEAMDHGGEITVDTSVCDGGDNVCIKVIDQGAGIEEERIAHLGEPFYSTKEKGTGLGLMVSYKIIEEHKGRMTFKSALGEGTTVEIVLPTQRPVLEVQTKAEEVFATAITA